MNRPLSRTSLRAKLTTRVRRVRRDGRRPRGAPTCQPDQLDHVALVPFIEEALQQTREAVAGYLEAATRDDLPLPAEDHLSDIVEIEVAAP